MVTAEIALGLSALAVVLAGGLWVVGAVSDQVRCQDAARDVARAVARGETEQVARAAGRRNAPDGARIRIGEDGGWVHVTVTVDAAPPWPALGGLPSVDVSATAAAAYEPGEPDASGTSGG